MMSFGVIPIIYHPSTSVPFGLELTEAFLEHNRTDYTHSTAREREDSGILHWHAEVAIEHDARSVVIENL